MVNPKSSKPTIGKSDPKKPQEGDGKGKSQPNKNDIEMAIDGMDQEPKLLTDQENLAITTASVLAGEQKI